MRGSARKRRHYKKKILKKIEQQLSNISLFKQAIKKAKKHATLS